MDTQVTAVQCVCAQCRKKPGVDTWPPPRAAAAAAHTVKSGDPTTHLVQLTLKRSGIRWPKAKRERRLVGKGLESRWVIKQNLKSWNDPKRTFFFHVTTPSTVRIKAGWHVSATKVIFEPIASHLFFMNTCIKQEMSNFCHLWQFRCPVVKLIFKHFSKLRAHCWQTKRQMSGTTTTSLLGHPAGPLLGLILEERQMLHTGCSSEIMRCWVRCLRGHQMGKEEGWRQRGLVEGSDGGRLLGLGSKLVSLWINARRN